MNPVCGLTIRYHANDICWPARHLTEIADVPKASELKCVVKLAKSDALTLQYRHNDQTKTLMCEVPFVVKISSREELLALVQRQSKHDNAMFMPEAESGL